MPRAQIGGEGYNNIGKSSYGDYTSALTETGIGSGFLQYLFYLIVILIIGLFILIFVNYTLYPVFRTRPGDKGIIGLPGSDDSKLFWKNVDKLATLNESDTPLGGLFQDWSMLLDIQVDNPTANTNYPRILFTRGLALNDPTQPFSDNDTILAINPNFNVCVWLDRMTNDLNVSVQTTEGTTTGTVQPYLESATIPNIPVGNCIRLGIMVGSRVLEVYVNGYLAKTKTYTKAIRASVGQLQPPASNILGSTARVMNLRVWPRPLSPSEFRSYGGQCNFGTKDMPDSCSA
jgi:hypothetical protein